MLHDVLSISLKPLEACDLRPTIDTHASTLMISVNQLHVNELAESPHLTSANTWEPRYCLLLTVGLCCFSIFDC